MTLDLDNMSFSELVDLSSIYPSHFWIYGKNSDKKKKNWRKQIEEGVDE